MPTVMTRPIESISAELRRQSISPPAGDFRIAAFARATGRLLKTPEGFEIGHILQLREMTGSSGVNLLLRCLQFQLVLLDPQYPLPYLDDELWSAAWQKVLHNPARRQQFLSDLSLRQVQSNVSERYKSLKLLALLKGLPNPRILDLGCSQNHGLKRLAGNVAFSPISGPDSSRLNSLLMQPLRVGQCLGTDIITLDNKSAAWARACSFYPSELLDTAAVRTYDQLNDAEFSNIEFSQLDATGQYSLSRQFDMVFVSTFLYQLTQDQLHQVRRLAKTALAEGGIIVYQDFFELGSDKEFKFPSNWFGQDYPYRTIVETSSELLEVFRWKDGRCRAFKPGRDYGRIITGD